MKLGRTILFILCSLVVICLNAQPYDATWDNVPPGLVINGNNYTLTSASGAGVKSCNRNLPLVDGSAEITLTNGIVPPIAGQRNEFSVGLHISNSPVNSLFSVKYSFRFVGANNGSSVTNQAYVVINGVQTNIITPALLGDIFMVRREGSLVRYYRNGVQVYSTNPGNSEFHRVGAYFRRLQSGGINVDINSSFICPYNVNWMNVPASLVINGDFYNLIGQPAGVKSLNKLQNMEDGHVEFTLMQNPAGSNFHMGLIQAGNPVPSGPSIDYNVQVNQNNASVWVNGFQVILPSIAANQADEFIVRRLGNRIMFYRNESLLHALSGAFTGEMRIGAYFSDTPDWGTTIDVDASFPDVPDIPPPTPVGDGPFIVLKRKLDASYTIVKGNSSLDFKYIEDYATTEGDDVSCNIYDSSMTPMMPAALLPNVYGVNWKSLSLPPTLEHDRFYILEVKNSNKGDVFYARFKYNQIK